MRITVASVLVSLAVVSEISAAIISSHPDNMLARRMPANTGTIQAGNNNCGGPNASPTPTKDNGPNGSEYWLTCGVTGDGWNPPPITKYNVKYVDLGSVINTPLFSACAQHLDAFNSAASQTGLPAILLASVALQQSSCNQYAHGRSGEIGLMQIYASDCPQNVDCFDPYTNIRITAQQLSDHAARVGDNLALTMGNYNGWYVGITVELATNLPTCAQRKDMDYLQKLFNGFMQGVNPTDLNMGVYFNTRC